MGAGARVQQGISDRRLETPWPLLTPLIALIAALA
jgi:hypothetical protein